MTEWRTISSAPTYEVSDEGAVRRRFVIRGKSPRVLKAWLNSKGYPVIRLQVGGKGVRHFVHQLAAAAFHGDPPPGQPLVDHRDRNPQNCTKDNLRWASQSQNLGNQLGKKSRVSRFKGVAKKRHGFAAYAIEGGRTLYLGTFAYEKEAAAAYDRDAAVRYGGFARLNFPQDGDETTRFDPPPFPWAEAAE